MTLDSSPIAKRIVQNGQSDTVSAHLRALGSPRSKSANAWYHFRWGSGKARGCGIPQCGLHFLPLFPTDKPHERVNQRL